MKEHVSCLLNAINPTLVRLARHNLHTLNESQKNDYGDGAFKSLKQRTREGLNAKEVNLTLSSDQQGLANSAMQRVN
ncbi:hypothetical protein T4B_9771 [Trichinella pseudospiralis]|uniref:Uncharacterized protein n=1 Tax=Trichinella pseudospiralis TaxID=6337 RepID=A0A0V1J750_TRIPS|nr:hypothetical protein T4B_9771 [Trichinella pseudospiralis]KRZ46406.1 hypothetical protein T4C_6398 [Trichinella pseudospiralis]